ncbi:hypothetical protein H4S14_003518 [Agrobacterium vitis]|nr:hypothetical protein [Agrobacterium vitis]MBE1439753.1 hypothetical protein [Agrobacterium vitis]
MSVTNFTEITMDDFMAFITHQRDAMIKAMLDYNDAVEGLQAIARMTPPDEPGVANLGEDNEVITRFVTATRAFKRISNTVGTV